MNIGLLLIFIAISGYLLGSLNSSLLVGKLYGIDVRKHGSGNAGATNTLRTLGKKAAILTVLGDFLKGVFACLVGRFVFQIAGMNDMLQIGLMMGGAGSIIGHNWPVFFGFKGGKGVLTSMAVLIMMDPVISIGLLILFIIVVAISKYISLGSILASIAFPIIAYLMGKDKIFILFALFISILIIFRHRSNIIRIMSGTESKFGQKKEIK